jgi:hypothetical protein
MSGWLSSGASYMTVSMNKVTRYQTRRSVFGIYSSWKRVDTITESEAQGLTETYANNEVAALFTDDIAAKSVRMNDANGFKVVKTEVNKGTWEEV